MCAHVGVELPHEAGEVVVLEIARQQLARKVLILQNRETMGRAGLTREFSI